MQFIFFVLAFLNGMFKLKAETLFELELSNSKIPGFNY